MSFYTDVIQKDPRYGILTQVRDPLLLEPHFRAAVQNIIAQARAMGHDLRLIETYRSLERQRMLFHEGLSQENPDKGDLGVHHFGGGADLGLFIDNVQVIPRRMTVREVYDPIGQDYMFLLDLAAKNPLPYGKLVSGIDWGVPPWEAHKWHDWDHLQFCEVAQQAALYRGEWYPPA